MVRSQLCVLDILQFVFFFSKSKLLYFDSHDRSTNVTTTPFLVLDRFRIETKTSSQIKSNHTKNPFSAKTIVKSCFSNRESFNFEKIRWKIRIPMNQKDRNCVRFDSTFQLYSELSTLPSPRRTVDEPITSHTFLLRPCSWVRNDFAW